MSSPASRAPVAAPLRPPALAALVLVLVSGLLLGSAATARGGARATAARAALRPNIVLITTDDQSLTDLRWMPLTRRWLGRTGVTFDNMLSPHPLCCPARAEIVTGQFAQNNGVHTNAGPYGGLPALRQPDNTIAAWLQRSGYRTAMVGKYLNGYQGKGDTPAGWDYWNVTTSNGFGYFDYPMNDNGSRRYYGHTYSTDLIADDTVGLVKQYAGGTEPFFIWASYYAPHGVCGDHEGCSNPPVPAPRHAHLYPGVNAPSLSKPSFNEDDVSDKPAMIRHRRKVGPAAAQHLFTERIRALAAVDEGVARTMQALEQEGQLDNTVVLFTSDNGYLVGEHRYKGKVVPYEEALRVPLLVTGPGVPAGVTRPQPVTTVDLAPTIVDLADAAPGRVIDGRSIWPFVLSGAVRRLDGTILIQAGGLPGVRHPVPWLYRGVWTHRYTFTRWSGSGFRELYDRSRDRYELVNLAARPAYRAVVAELDRRTRVLKDCAGAGCRVVFGTVPSPGVSG